MLYIFLAAIAPFWLLDFGLRALELTPPVWLGDILTWAFLALGIGILRIGLRERRLARQAASQAIANPGPIPKAWEEFFLCLVHEIRNYSSILKGNARLLRSLAVTGSDMEPICRLERTTHKIECLAQEILETATSSRLHAPKPLCILALLETCLAEHFHPNRNAIILSVQGALPVIEGDPGKLERVFINLFKNSFEAGAASIHVSLVALPDRMRLLVEDDGVGCEPKNIGQLFRPLYSTKKDIGGTGLGLYLIKTIMQAHGGAVWAVTKNTWGGNQMGMIFCLEFPVPGMETLALKKPDKAHLHKHSLGGLVGG